MTGPRRPLALSLALAAAVAGCGMDEDESAARTPAKMVDAHNTVRARATPTPSPALGALSWSDELAATAQAWADGCTYAHNPRLRERSLGENIAATAPAGRRTATDIVGLWAAEAPFYDYASNTCDAANPANEPGTCGHYTQLVWRATRAVGCAMRTCTTGSPFGETAPTWDFWVCDYAPPGNFIGQRPY